MIERKITVSYKVLLEGEDEYRRGKVDVELYWVGELDENGEWIVDDDLGWVGHDDGTNEVSPEAAVWNEVWNVQRARMNEENPFGYNFPKFEDSICESDELNLGPPTDKEVAEGYEGE